jgi:hypothetical protein
MWNPFICEISRVISCEIVSHVKFHIRSHNFTCYHMISHEITCVNSCGFFVRVLSFFCSWIQNNTIRQCKNNRYLLLASLNYESRNHTCQWGVIHQVVVLFSRIAVIFRLRTNRPVKQRDTTLLKYLSLMLVAVLCYLVFWTWAQKHELEIKKTTAGYKYSRCVRKWFSNAIEIGKYFNTVSTQKKVIKFILVSD